jgi:hypothetical protein
MHAELDRLLDRSRAKPSKSTRKEDMITYLNSQIALLSQHLPNQTSEIIAIKLWRIVLKVFIITLL